LGLEVLLVVEELGPLLVAFLRVLVAVAMEVVGQHWRAAEEHTH